MQDKKHEQNQQYGFKQYTTVKEKQQKFSKFALQTFILIEKNKNKNKMIKNKGGSCITVRHIIKLC